MFSYSQRLCLHIAATRGNRFSRPSARRHHVIIAIIANVLVGMMMELQDDSSGAGELPRWLECVLACSNTIGPSESITASVISSSAMSGQRPRGAAYHLFQCRSELGPAMLRPCPVPVTKPRLELQLAAGQHVNHGEAVLLLAWAPHGGSERVTPIRSHVRQS